MILYFIISVVTGAALFLCAEFTWHKAIKQFVDELRYQNSRLQLDNTTLSEQYINLMDVTRHEALDSYRKGLQDGLSIPDKRNMTAVEQKPVKTITEYAQDAADNFEQRKNAAEEASDLAAMFAYNGDIPKNKG